MDSKTSDNPDLDLDAGWDTPTPTGSEPSAAKPAGRHAPQVQGDASSAAGRTDATSLATAGMKQSATDDLDDGWDLDLPSAPQTPSLTRPTPGRHQDSSPSRPGQPDALRSSRGRRKTKSDESSAAAKADTAAPLPPALTGRRQKSRTKARIHRKSQERAAKSKQQRQARAKQRKELRAERRRQRREAAEAANRAANPGHSDTDSRPERRPPSGSSDRDSAPAARPQATPDASTSSRRQPRIVVRKRQRTTAPATAKARRPGRTAESQAPGRSVSAADPRTNRGIAVLLVIAVAVGVLIWLARGG